MDATTHERITPQGTEQPAGTGVVGRPRTPPPSGAPSTWRRRRNLAPVLLLSPALIVLTLVTVVPILILLGTSFTDYDQRSLFTGAVHWVGVHQYADLVQDAAFWRSLVRTVLFTGAMVAGSVAIGVGVSHLLTRLGRIMRYVLTIVLILSWAMPNVASSLVWNWLFQPGYGVVNWMLTQLGVFGDLTDVSWAQNPTLAYICIWFLIVWQAVPFIALTLNAAETQVPQDYQEAARLDGANEWKVYRSITLVFLRPTLFLITILSVIWDYNVFNQIWLVSRGGPGDSTSTLGVFTYKTAFVGFQIGQGAAISVVTTLILLGLTAFYIRNLIRLGEDL